MTGGPVFIAHRGEVAVRIAAACRELGMRSIVAATADDGDATFVRAADGHAVLPGHGPAAYLDVASVVDAAHTSGARLVHPGYGFLSEKVGFARALADEGLVFVGPAAETLELFGDKTAARAFAAAHDIPVLAASGPVHDASEAGAFAASRTGPLIVKAAAGGGGRGIRVVRDRAGLAAALERAASEAARAFGDDTVYIESYLPHARHVEVQILGDGEAVVALGTRDCSIQRRHQKVLEFAPAPGLIPEVEAAMTDAALRLARESGYRGLGTVEFLVDAVRGTDFFFIEVNPRLQVEHGVTELVTGLDLVALQLRVAAGARVDELGLDNRPPIVGYAGQARITAEPGMLRRFRPPSGARVDHGVREGETVAPGFDPLLAKVLVSAPTWPELIVELSDAVSGFDIEGPRTSLADVRALLDAPDVRAGALSTTLADRLRETDDPPAAELRSPTAGTVVALGAEAGALVAAGRPVVVVEAMKMEHEIVAPTGSRVDALLVAVGDRVEASDTVALLSPADDAPIDTEPGAPVERTDLANLRARRDRTLDAARPEAVARRRSTGKRTARENVAGLLDGDLIELGALVVAAQRRRRPLDELERETPADGVVTGFGPVADVGQVGVLAYDYTVLAGTQGLQSHKKSERLFDLARRRGAPVVVYAEGGGGRPGDTDNDAKATGMDLGTFVAFGRLSGVVPTVAIASGRCFAGNAALVGASDVVIATRDANIGMGGPAMIEGAGLGRVSADDIGPASHQFANGVVDVLVEDEAEATAVARRYLSYFAGPRDGGESLDQSALRDIVPRNRARVFDVRALITTLADVDSMLELRAGWGRAIVTALARIDGRPVGIVANDGAQGGGAIDSDGADKMTRFLRLCDGFGIPIVTLCDTPGFLVGPASEDAAAVRHVGRLFVTAPNLSVPLCTVVVRRAWGLGGQAMAGGGFRVPDAIVAWPTAEFGAMGPEGAVRLGFRRELDAIADLEERDAEFRRRVDDYVADGSGPRAASVFEIDDVIDPAHTRAWITASLARPAVRDAGRPRPLDTW